MLRHPPEATPDAAPPTSPLVSRRHRLRPPSGPAARVARAVKDGFESLVARSSVHGDPPVYDARTFPWVEGVEASWKTIRAELEGVMKHRERLANFHDITPQVRTITKDDDWKTFFLVALGEELERNARLCPETVRIVKTIPGLQTAFFSILSPGKHIPPHRGAYNGVLRYHLGLIVPEPRELCRIRVADRMLTWAEGESLIFDDTFNHEVWNDTGGFRAVLFVDFLRPLRFPMSVVNRSVVGAARALPILREARENQKDWEQRFYDRAGTDH